MPRKPSITPKNQLIAQAKQHLRDMLMNVEFIGRDLALMKQHGDWPIAVACLDVNEIKAHSIVEFHKFFSDLIDSGFNPDEALDKAIADGWLNRILSFETTTE